MQKKYYDISENENSIFKLGSISKVASEITKIYFDDQPPEQIIYDPIRTVLAYILYKLYVKNQSEFLNIQCTENHKKFLAEFDFLFQLKVKEKEFKDYTQFYKFHEENNIYSIYKNKYKKDPTPFTLCKKVLKRFKEKQIISDFKLECIPK